MRTDNSIIIEREPEEVFAITNDLESWPRLFANYKRVTVLDRKQKDGSEEVWFEIEAIPHEDEDGEDDHDHVWRSRRLIDHTNMTAIGIREDPMFPFSSWKLTITYEPAGSGHTKMSWIQDFKMDPKSDHTDQEIADWINKESPDEMADIKKRIEGWEP